MAKTPSTPQTRALAAQKKRRQEHADLERRKALAAQQPLAPIAGTSIVPEARFGERTLHPYGDGPWKGESEKVAWTDAATGYPCIILRQRSGELAGYVGVEPDHALAGWSADALPGSINDGLHQTVSYAAACQSTLPERISVCHVTVSTDAAPSRAMHENQVHEARSSGRAGARQNEDLAWWFGTIMNGLQDYVPRRQGGLSHERGQVYRGEHFVYRQVTELARKLKAIDAAAQRNIDDTTSPEPSVLPAPKSEDHA